MRSLLLVMLLSFAASAVTVETAVDNILGIEPVLAATLKKSLGQRFGTGYDLEVQSTPVTDFLARGVVNQVSPDRIAAAATILNRALRNGAPPQLASDIAEIGFASDITASQIEAACRATVNGRRFGLNSAIVNEMILNCIEQSSDGSIIEGAILGLEKGVRRNGIPQDKMAVALMIRLSQNNSGKKISAIIDEEIQFIKENVTPAQKRIDKTMADLVARGIDGAIVREVYTTALEEHWKLEETQSVLDGLYIAYLRHLTIERVAIACIVQIAQGYTGTSDQMVDTQLNFVTQLPQEQMRLQQLDQKPQLKAFIDQARSVTMSTDKDSGKKKPAPVIPSQKSSDNSTIESNYLQTGSGLNTDALEQSIQSFLIAKAPQRPSATPYLWGGTSRDGVDCSGFTMVCYKENGIVIPRTSQDQFSAFSNRGQTVGRDNLQYGDLVYFTSNGHGRITHVGMFYKKNENNEALFVQSSCSMGVNVCNLDKDRYWNPRFAGAVRVVR